MHSYRLYDYLLLVLSFVLRLYTPMLAEEKPTPVSYDLKVVIGPAPGTLRVRARIEVPTESPRIRGIQFALHETLAINKLSLRIRTE
jgi:hypothetical protein